MNATDTRTQTERIIDAGKNDTERTRSLLMGTYVRHERVQRYDTKKAYDPETKKTAIVATSCRCDLCRAIRVRYEIQDPGKIILGWVPVPIKQGL